MSHNQSVLKFIQSEAGRKSWVTRRKNIAKIKRKQSRAGKKAWATRRRMATLS